MDANPYAPPVAPTAAQAQPAGSDPFARDRYLLKQKVWSISEVYKIFGEGEEELLYVRRPARLGRNLLSLLAALAGLGLAIAVGVGLGAAVHPVAGVLAGLPLAVGALALGVRLAPLRHLEFCADPGLTRELLRVTQDNRWAFPVARWSLLDAQGRPLARFRKNVLWNLIRRRWYVDGPDGAPLLLAKEDSVVKAIIRRVAPDLIAAFMRTNFVILDPGGARRLGIFNRKLALRDHYVLDLGDDPERSVDRRIALALGVLLDTGERR